MMLGCNHDKPHPSILTKGDPFFRVECFRIKRLRRRRFILGDWDFCISHDPFCTLGFLPNTTDLSIGSPVDEHADFIMIQLLNRLNQLGRIINCLPLKITTVGRLVE